ncbi:DUF1345 domain-containing protein [Achromobacter piechaudii]|uniref:DUF1345 domain-containing protein n=1 Tax=Achromobacter piechaudii TaxID=72556 RepID=A0A6S7C619_9BURK|nr:DUF1345 domain-containing protein [Achromobacter piechaudii]CAB3821758.1 hypothetical protein LMG1861_00295 [Achromobacter piechaudii]
MTKPIPDEPQAADPQPDDAQSEKAQRDKAGRDSRADQGHRSPESHDDAAASSVDRLPFFHAHRRLVGCAVLFVAVGGAAYALGRSSSLALLLGFDAAALVFLVLTAKGFSQASSASMRVHARQQDVGRLGVLWSSVALSCMVLVALWVELRGSDSMGGVVDMLAAAATIVLSWLYMNMIFALHYAHGYYGHRSGAHKGLDFPGTQEPDYWDFAYFAMVLGMTFQVSDVQIVNRRVRRMALMHSVIAFFFNVFIIAISVNVAAGKA